MFYVELAPLGDILGPLKSDLGRLILLKPKTHFFLQKGPFPPTDLAENLCVDSQTPPRSKSKSWQMGNPGPKISLRRGVRRRAANSFITEQVDKKLCFLFLLKIYGLYFRRVFK